MTQTTQTTGRTPWHLWLVGAVAVVLNGMGSYDYVMTHTGGADYLRTAQFTDAEIAHVMSYPAWMTAVWAIGVWGGLVGALLLLFRRKWALYAFGASLAAFVISLIYTYVLTSGGEVLRSSFTITNGVILALCVFFAWYAWFVNKHGLLR